MVFLKVTILKIKITWKKVILASLQDHLENGYLKIKIKIMPISVYITGYT